MKPLINVLIILSVSILLGILIIPRLKKGKYRIEGGITLDLNALSKAGLLKKKIYLYALVPYTK